MRVLLIALLAAISYAQTVHPVGELCIIGGRLEEGAVRCFDGASWSLVEEAAFPVVNMYRAASAYLNGKPCVIGGRTDPQCYDTTFCYVDGSWEQWPSLNIARHDHQIIEIDGFPCAVGGVLVPSNRLSSVECWDGNEWREDLIPDLTEPRYGHTAMFIKGYPCVALGAARINSIECYVDGEWTQDEVEWDTNLQLMIAYADYGVLNGYDCIIGGYNSRVVLSEVHCFNEESNSWETDLVPNMNGIRNLFATITLPDGTVCAMPYHHVDTIECFDGTSWNTNDPIPSPGVPQLQMYNALVLDIPNLSGGVFESNSADEDLCYEFFHDGHCAGGHIPPNTDQNSLQDCYATCNAVPDAGFFAFSSSAERCSCYTLSAGCPDDNNFPDRDAYRIINCETTSSEVDTNSLDLEDWTLHFTDINCAGALSGDSDLTIDQTTIEVCLEACADFAFAAFWDVQDRCRCYNSCDNPAPTAESHPNKVYFQALEPSPSQTVQTTNAPIETCDDTLTTSAGAFWPTEPETPSDLGVILHTHTTESDGTPLHAAFRVPVGLYTVLPGNWHVANGYVTWYCNNDCTDEGSPGGCTPRDGGIMNWPDNAAEDASFRQCLMDSVEMQGGEWAPLEDCQVTESPAEEMSGPETTESVSVDFAEELRRTVSCGGSGCVAIQRNGNAQVWGDRSYIGNHANVDLTNMAQVICTSSAGCVAIKADGSAESWGRGSHALVDVSNVDLSDVVDVICGQNMCVALKEDNTAEVWGSGAGADVSAVDLTNIVKVSCGNDNCVALKADGTVEVWGNHRDISRVEYELTNVIDVVCTCCACAALRSDNVVQSWGWPTYGGERSFTDVIDLIAGDQVFVAIYSDHTIEVFGHNQYGGNYWTRGYGGHSHDDMTDIVEVTCGRACVAIKSDRSALVWGHPNYGGNADGVDLTNIESVACGTQSCVAIKFDRTAEAWGGWGGDASDVDLTNVLGVHCGPAACVAVKMDRTAEVWGRPGYGGPPDQSNPLTWYDWGPPDLSNIGSPNRVTESPAEEMGVPETTESVSGEICIIGGRNWQGQYLAEVRCFDGNEWTLVEPLPAIRYTAQGAYLNGNPCVIGGGRDVETSVFCYVNGVWETWPGMNAPWKEGFAMIEIEGKTCAVGFANSGLVDTTLDCWDGNMWRKNWVPPPDRAYARSGITAIHIKGYPCLVGDRSRTVCYVNGQWTEDEVPGLPNTRWYAKSAVINGYPCVIGGENTNQVICFDEESNSWDVNLVPNMNEARAHFDIVTLSDGMICAFGVFPHGSGATECFDGSTWNMANPIAEYPVDIYRHVALLMDVPSLHGSYELPATPMEDSDEHTRYYVGSSRRDERYQCAGSCPLYMAHVSEIHNVACCTEEEPDGWTSRMNYRNQHKCHVSAAAGNMFDEGCQELNYNDAKEFCESKNARLCTRHEIDYQCVTSGSCGIDLDPFWTSTPGDELSGEQICVAGGLATWSAINRVRCFDGEFWNNIEPLPERRQRFGIAYLNGNPCVVGGETQGRQYRDTVFCLVDDRWETWPNLNIGRSEFAIIEINGMPCAAGGLGTASNTRNNVECWDGTEWNSDLIPGMRVYRYSHTSVYIKGYPCLIGGSGTNNNNNVECFVDGQWTFDEVPGIHGSRIEFGKAAIINGHSCVLGGEGRSNVVCFNEESNSWDDDLVPDFSQTKYGHAITTFADGTVCTIAGREQNSREWKSECFDGSSWVEMDPRVRFFPENIYFHEAFVKQFPSLESTQASTDLTLESISLEIGVIGVTEDNKDQVCDSIANALGGSSTYCSLAGPQPGISHLISATTLYMDVTVSDTSSAQSQATGSNFVDSLSGLPAEVTVTSMSTANEDPVDHRQVKRLFKIVPEMMRKTKGQIRKYVVRLRNRFADADANYNQDEMDLIESIYSNIDSEDPNDFEAIMEQINRLNTYYRTNGERVNRRSTDDILNSGIVKNLLRVAGGHHFVGRKAEVNRLMNRIINRRRDEGLHHGLLWSEDDLEEMTRREDAPAHEWLPFTYQLYLELQAKYNNDGFPTNN